MPSDDSVSLLTSGTNASGWSVNPIARKLREVKLQQQRKKASQVAQTRQRVAFMMQPKQLSFEQRERLEELRSAKLRQRGPSIPAERYSSAQADSWWQQNLTKFISHSRRTRFLVTLCLIIALLLVLHLNLFLKTELAKLESPERPSWVHVLWDIGMALYILLCGVLHFLTCDIALIYAFGALDLGSKAGRQVKSHYIQNVHMGTTTCSLGIMASSIMKAIAQVYLPRSLWYLHKLLALVGDAVVSGTDLLPPSMSNTLGSCSKLAAPWARYVWNTFMVVLSWLVLYPAKMARLYLVQSNPIGRFVDGSFSCILNVILAFQVQEQLDYEDDLERKKLQDMAERGMQSSAAGKAWKFVERVHQLYRSKAHRYGEEPVSINDMVYLAKQMFEAQQDFRDRGLPSTVDIGYHYTTRENMDRIQTDGLLNRAEREAKSIKNNFHGETYGPGIYTGNDHKTFSKYGTVGLIVARLKGKEMDPVMSERQYTKGNTAIVVGPLVVLQRSCQCLALLRFSRRHADSVMHMYRSDLFELIDEFFDREDYSPVPLARAMTQILPNLQTLPREAGTAVGGKANVAPSDPLARLPTKRNKEPNFGSKPLYKPLDRKHTEPSSDDEKKMRWAIESPREVLCYYAPSNILPGHGMMPSGVMCVYRDTTVTCAGFSPGAIVIRYSIPPGIQQSYHADPGRDHDGAERKAYLPDNDSGQRLISRLKYAFMHGFTFTVWTSVTTGRANSVVWASIPHKTSIVGGPYGFPDVGYFPECNSQLDILSVPR